MRLSGRCWRHLAMGSRLSPEAAYCSCRCSQHCWPTHFTSTHLRLSPTSPCCLPPLQLHGEDSIFFMAFTHRFGCRDHVLPFLKNRVVSSHPFDNSARNFSCLEMVQALCRFAPTHWFTNFPGIFRPEDLRPWLLKWFVQRLQLFSDYPVCLPTPQWPLHRAWT